FSHRSIQFEELDGKEYPNQRNSQSFQDTPSSGTPLLPAIVAFELAPPDTAYPRALAMWTLIISSDDSLLSKIFLGSLFIGRVLLQLDQIHPIRPPEFILVVVIKQSPNFLLRFFLSLLRGEFMRCLVGSPPGKVRGQGKCV